MAMCTMSTGRDRTSTTWQASRSRSWSRSRCSLLGESTGRSHHCILFVRERDPERETWDGRRYAPRGANSEFGGLRRLVLPHAKQALDGTVPTMLAYAR